MKKSVLLISIMFGIAQLNAKIEEIVVEKTEKIVVVDMDAFRGIDQINERYTNYIQAKVASVFNERYMPNVTRVFKDKNIKIIHIGQIIIETSKQKNSIIFYLTGNIDSTRIGQIRFTEEYNCICGHPSRVSIDAEIDQQGTEMCLEPIKIYNVLMK